MPPRKKTNAKKTAPRKSKRSSGMRQTVKVSVRVREGAGGGGAAPIVYATYTPTPPAQPTQFLFDDGMPPVPVKRAPAHHRFTGVYADQPSTYSTGSQFRIKDMLKGHDPVPRPPTALKLEPIRANPTLNPRPFKPLDPKPIPL